MRSQAAKGETRTAVWLMQSCGVSKGKHSPKANDVGDCEVIELSRLLNHSVKR